MTRSFPSPESGRRGRLGDSIFSTMCRRGTVAATCVAKVPQSNRRGTLSETRIRQHVRNGSDIQPPNLGFAAYRGLQLPSQHHMSARRIVPRRATTPQPTLGKWHGNWIIIARRLGGFIETTLVEPYSGIRR